MGRASASKEIIIVEDDSGYRAEITALLNKAGYKVTALESGNHALRYFDEQTWAWSPRIIITDLVMDGFGGYQLIRRVHERYPRKNIPIIVISRLGGAEDIMEADAAGATAYITKPLRENDLLEVLDKVSNAIKSGKKLNFFSRSLNRPGTNKQLSPEN